jgi:hypothetical protein
MYSLYHEDQIPHLFQYLFQGHPETHGVTHRYGGGAGRPGSSFRVHIRQNLLDSRNDTQLPRNTLYFQRKPDLEITEATPT